MIGNSNESNIMRENRLELELEKLKKAISLRKEELNKVYVNHIIEGLTKLGYEDLLDIFNEKIKKDL